MKPLRTYLTLGLLGGILYYVFPVFSVLKLSFSFITFHILKIAVDAVQLAFRFNVSNPSRQLLKIQETNISIYIADQYVGSFNNPMLQVLPAGSSGEVVITVNLLPEVIGQELFTYFVSGNFGQFIWDIKLKGTIKVNSRIYPIQFIITAKQIQDEIQYYFR